MIKFYHPKRNLGCAGIKIGEKFYADYYKIPRKGVFVRIGNWRCTITGKGFFPWR